MPIKKIELIQVLSLKRELDDLLKENLSFSVKYWLSKLQKSILAEFNHIDQIKNDLIAKHGKPIGDKHQIFHYDESFPQFQTELSEFLSEEIEIDVKKFTLADFADVKSTNFYPEFYSLVDEE